MLPRKTIFLIRNKSDMSDLFFLLIIVDVNHIILNYPHFFIVRRDDFNECGTGAGAYIPYKQV